MCFLPDDDRHLQRALSLARESAAFASPNPTVGCVLARDGEVLGEGAHYYDKRDHAEIVALKQAVAQGRDPRGATAYVTLEPCSHHGRTGPCADALAAAGIGRCVVATIDPNPAVRGQGLAKLRGAGVDVALLDAAAPLAQQARRLNDAFAFSIQQGRPFVTLKAAVSLDGKLAPAPHKRSIAAPHWLTGEAARADVQRLRHASDAILTGIGTILADNPALTDRSGLARQRPLLRVVLDSELRTPLEASVASAITNDLLLLASERAAADKAEMFRLCGAEVERLRENAAGGLDLRAALDALHGRQIRSVMLEGGSRLNAAFLRAGLVDRVVLYTAESELGDDAVPFAQGHVSPDTLEEHLSARTRDVFAHSAESSLEDVRIAGFLHDPWKSVP